MRMNGQNLNDDYEESHRLRSVFKTGSSLMLCVYSSTQKIGSLLVHCNSYINSVPTLTDS
mgnify:FL=1